MHWAHRAAHRFPDGQLYLNLRGYEERAPLRPAEALSTLLGALGVPPQRVPSDVDGASALLRDTLAGRLAFACRFHFNGRLDGPTALEVGRAAVDAADRTGDVRARAAAALVMARAYTTDSHDDRCRALAQRCLDLARDCGWHDIESDVHNTLSVHPMFAGDLRLAGDHARLALDHAMASGVVPPQFLGKVGLIMLLMGRLAEAADCFEQTLAHQRAGFGRAVTLLNLAETRRLQGRAARRPGIGTRPWST